MRWVLLFFPYERESVVARGYEPWDSAERELDCRLSDGMVMVMVWWWWYIDPRIKTWLWNGNGVECVRLVLKLDQLLLCTWYAKYIGNPSLIGSFEYIRLASNYHKAMLIGLGVVSTNRTDKFWHTGSAEEYSSEEFDGWGIRSYARVWRSILQAVLDECYLWFRQCGDVIM